VQLRAAESAKGQEFRCVYSSTNLADRTIRMANSESLASK